MTDEIKSVLLYGKTKLLELQNKEDKLLKGKEQACEEIKAKCELYVDKSTERFVHDLLSTIIKNRLVFNESTITYANYSTLSLKRYIMDYFERIGEYLNYDREIKRIAYNLLPWTFEDLSKSQRLTFLYRSPYTDLQILNGNKYVINYSKFKTMLNELGLEYNVVGFNKKPSIGYSVCEVFISKENLDALLMNIQDEETRLEGENKLTLK